MSGPAFYDEVRALRLARLLDASVTIITEEGWDRLTMTKVAQLSGVPRQSLHKEVGTKSELGQAVVAREVERFLAGVRAGIAAHPDSTEDGVVAAARFALEYGDANAVLKAILAPAQDPQLLELLTVRPEAVLAQASRAVATALGETGSEAVVDVMVRLVLSYLLQPTVEVEVAVERIRHAVRGLSSSAS